MLIVEALKNYFKAGVCTPRFCVTDKSVNYCSKTFETKDEALAHLELVRSKVEVLRALKAKGVRFSNLGQPNIFDMIKLDLIKL
jgi:hypothetical protein